MTRVLLGLLLLWPAANLVAADSVDESRAKSVGIRKIASRHLVLYTDLPSSEEVDELPALFDQAVPQWAAYFKVDQAKTADWQAEAFLIGERFMTAPDPGAALAALLADAR